MRFLRAAMLLTVAAWLPAGCERAPPPDVPASQRAHDDRLQWQGSRPCTDCGGIETTLVLAHAGDERHYELVETYLTAAGGDRFVEAGRWRTDDGVLRLEGDGGSLRSYVLLRDGRLQVRDGRRLPGDRHDALVPVAGPATDAWRSEP